MYSGCPTKSIMKVKKWLEYEVCTLEYKEYMIEHNKAKIQELLEQKGNISKRIFYVDTRGLKDSEVDHFIKEFKKPLVDPKTGNIKHNAIVSEQDYLSGVMSEPTKEESISFKPKEN